MSDSPVTSQDPVPVLDRHSKENRWYYKEINDQVQPISRKLLEEYSHIPANEIDAHIYKMRDILWSHAPYPCVGEFKFLDLRLPKHPLYTQILTTLRKPSSPILDMGCCVASDLRSLAHNGIPSTQLFGTDIISSYLTTSYSVFKDTDTFHGTLVPANIFSPSLFSDEFAGWEGRFSIIHAGLFLHLFNWEQQLTVCEIIAKLLKEEEGAILVGEMVGCQGGGLRGGPANTDFWKKERRHWQYLHDEESFARLWGEVEGRTGTEGMWKVDSKFVVRRQEKGGDGSKSCAFFEGEGIGWFTFSVARVMGS
ncbi:uncharacterized protein LY89DRAFT_603944 [Mollisia scopiformis]|uniref:Methyltransferase domain-containing protein n=1 Tax=Mollisia scopiformis TaxID=149040 RepID=A0A194XU52_MOLSC|nr:uncharacterized protein LY89DRAFT_603944 [Mollisia scopiformis]KUJ23738.1 hypothetical protein LY89DRAFT_603944 [Mollisia scopiformis]